MRVSSSGRGAWRLATAKASRTKKLIFLSRIVLRACAGSSLPHLDRRKVRLQDERAALDQAAQRVAVAEHLVVGRDDDLDVLEFGVGQQHRLGAQRDVVVGRGAALLRAVLRRRLRMQAERAGENVGEQLAGGDGAVAADRVEAGAEGALRQQVRVRAGLERHEFGLGIGRLQPRFQLRHVRAGVLGEELRAEVDERRVLLSMFLKAATRWRGCRSCAPRPKIAVVTLAIGAAPECRDAPGAVRVLARLEQRLGDESWLSTVTSAALEHGDRLLAIDGGDELGLGERRHQLDRDEPTFLPLLRR